MRTRTIAVEALLSGWHVRRLAPVLALAVLVTAAGCATSEGFRVDDDYECRDDDIPVWVSVAVLTQLAARVALELLAHCHH